MHTILADANQPLQLTTILSLWLKLLQPLMNNYS